MSNDEIQRNLNNELAPKIVKEIIKRVSRTGGKPSDMLAVLESVTATLLVLSSIPGQEEHAADNLNACVKQRIKIIQAMERAPEGSA